MVRFVLSFGYIILRHVTHLTSDIQMIYINVYLSEPTWKGAESKKMDLSNGTVYTELYTELEGYERNGVCLLMEGSHVSPMQVVRELMAREEVICGIMR